MKAVTVALRSAHNLSRNRWACYGVTMEAKMQPKCLIDYRNMRYGSPLRRGFLNPPYGRNVTTLLLGAPKALRPVHVHEGHA
jgi:hypothetical protein